MRTSHSALIPFFILAACGTAIQQTGINVPPHAMAARPPESVEVFTSGVPARAHVDVAMLQAQQQSSFSQDGTAAMIAELRVTAAAMGCDGLVITGPNDAVLSDRAGTVTLHGLTGTCIVYD